MYEFDEFDVEEIEFVILDFLEGEGEATLSLIMEEIEFELGYYLAPGDQDWNAIVDIIKRMPSVVRVAFTGLYRLKSGWDEDEGDW